MKKIYFIFALLASSVAFAQEDAWVYFNDKPNADTYLGNPLTMLSQRSLDRRVAQGIGLDTKDAPIEQSFIEQIAQLGTVEVMAKSKWLNAIHVRGSQSEINALAAFNFVDHVQFANPSLNPAGKPRRQNASHTTAKTLDTQVDFPYGSSANQIEMLNGQFLHQQGYTGQGKIVAVLDAGFPGVNTVQPFKRLRDNNQILGGYNFVDRNEDIYTRSSHGTMVLSTMGGYVQNQLVGTAPDASYYLFITEDVNGENPIEESFWVEAVERADSLGVDVVNTSLGYFGYDNPNYSHTYEDMDGQTTFSARGANIAFTRGMIMVVSAGNSGNSSDPFIATPADAINAFTIGAVDAFGDYASFSSIGPSFDGRVKPDVDAQGQASVVANPSGAVVTASGTSFSGPIMAGMVASFWQAYPQLTNAQVMQVVRESASLYENPTDEMGYGIPDFMAALNLASLATGEVGASKFVVFPNPAQEQISILLPDNVSQAHMTIYNPLGQVVAQKSISSHDRLVNLENLGSGVYLYTLTAGQTTQSGKLIKG
ncbi:Subtilisin NAT [Flavobacterium longum]|uniref:S8 family serine peptidase n=1 Tax=Flavobacterium longum TaxID=1299340 RepID=UPI0039EC905C